MTRRAQELPRRSGLDHPAVWQDEFDAEKARAQGAYVERRKAATAAIVRARGAYRKAGARD